VRCGPVRQQLQAAPEQTAAHAQVLRYPADLPERWLRAVQVGDAPLDHLALLVRQTNAFFVACSVVRINNVSTADGQIIRRRCSLCSSSHVAAFDLKGRTANMAVRNLPFQIDLILLVHNRSTPLAYAQNALSINEFNVSPP